MAPTEYRVIAKRAEPRATPGLRVLVAAGEALDPGVLGAWHEATGLWIRDGYGQTETGQLTGDAAGRARARRARWAGRSPASRWTVDDGELVLADPATDPTFFLRYLGEAPHAGPWRTGDRVRADEDGFLYFEGRTDDVIISAGYRIGPVEVETALGSHPAVADAAVVAAPDDERGSVVRAVVVLRDGHAPSPRSPPSSRTTSRSGPRRTSTPGSSTSRPSSRARRAARSAARRSAEVRLRRQSRALVPSIGFQRPSARLGHESAGRSGSRSSRSS